MNKEQKLQVALFDLDGTLANTPEISLQTWNVLLKKYKPNAKLTTNEYKQVFGKGSIHTASTIVSKYNLPVTPKAFVKEKRKMYKILLPKTKIMLGVKKFIQHIKPTVKIGLVSNSLKKEVKLVLDAIKMEDVFEHQVTIDDVCCLKPAPDMYEKALAYFSQKPTQCIAFEDSTSGIAAAKLAGIFTVAVPNKYTKNQDFSLADQKITSWNITLKQLEKSVAKKRANK
ncbi:hypothetical protein COV18_00640 [Candidatus Woesearchaeota archaeon CG10_big_fil_rev_8_21_14_0_10_37_12]|nr:MAG: hypothetical protein COV18_00640 [Candidatus Woesearchaeota archaeon CG10_big_fil_rev_8_21_14_0_10_37_12]